MVDDLMSKSMVGWDIDSEPSPPQQATISNRANAAIKLHIFLSYLSPPGYK